MKIRVLAFLCAVVLLLGTAPTFASAATPLIKTNIPTTFPVIKQDSSATVVNFWHAMTGRYAVAVDKLANWYNAVTGKQKKIYVKPIFQGVYDDITIKIQATLQSGVIKDLPDLVQLSQQGAFSCKESNRILYMEDMMNADKSFNIRNKFNKNEMFACSYKGKQLGLPFSMSMIMMHYNVAAFKAVGLDPDNPPKTLAEFAAAAEKLAIKGTGKKPVRYGATTKVTDYQVSTWIPRMLDGKTSFQFNNEEGYLGTPTKYICAENGSLKTCLTEWKKVLDTGVVDYLTLAPRANFETGLTAMYLDSMVQYDTIDQQQAAMNASKRFEHRMYRIPTVTPSDTIYEGIGGSAVFMFDKGDAKKVAATWDFVKFLGSVDASAFWYVNTGYYPLNGDAINTDYVQNTLKKLPNKKVCLEILKSSEPGYKYQLPLMPSYAVFNNFIGDQVALMGQGKQTVDQAVGNIAKKAAQILKTYWDANS